MADNKVPAALRHMLALNADHTNLETLAEMIAVLSIALSSSSKCLVYLNKIDKGLVSVAYACDDDDADNDIVPVLGTVCPPGVGISGRVAETGKSFRTKKPNAYLDERVDIVLKHFPILCVPVKASNGNVTGMVQLSGKDGGYTRQNQKALERFLNLTAIATKGILQQGSHNNAKQLHTHKNTIYKKLWKRVTNFFKMSFNGLEKLLQHNVALFTTF